jgi:hypothetical protein
MRSSRVISIFVFIVGVALLPALVTAQLIPLLPHNLPPDPASSDPQEDSVAAKSLHAKVAAMLLRGNYDEIDRLAEKLRSEKTRLPGGVWKLLHLYEGLRAPDRSHPEDQIARLNAWIAARPQSITPRVALAEVYLKYAWAARGSGLADTVTDDGWRLFAERAAKAKKVLDDSTNLTPMCPEWFSKMQTVALAQDWDAERTAALFEQAIKFEPDYIYFYNAYTHYLLPKWDGKPGDDAAFAKKSADAVGGPKGDFLYFHIGMAVLATNNGKVDTEDMDWGRLQRGYQALIGLYGVTNFDTNQLAMFAWRFHDRAVASEAFAQIGDKWSKGVWKKRDRFDKARAWAGPLAPLPMPTQGA